MKILRDFWQKLAEEKYTMRTVNILMTILTLYTVIFTPISPQFAWVAGVLNGAMWLIDIFSDDD